MNWICAVVVVLGSSLTAISAPPSLKLPAEVKGEPGEFIVIKAQTDGKKLSYKAIDKGLNLVPRELINDPKTIIATSIRPGKYRIHVVTALGDEPSDIVEVVVIIAGASPEPAPEPKPKPDELTLVFIKAYAGETASDKKDKWKALIVLMKNAATMSDDTSFKTNSDLIAAVGRLTRNGIGTSLMDTRKVIGDYLNKNLPTDDVELSADLRVRIKAAYLKIASSMEAAINE